MKDERAIGNMVVLIVNYIAYNFYLYELFWGNWEAIKCRAFFYFINGCALSWFTIGDWKGWTTVQQLHTSIMYKLSLIITFFSFLLILRGKYGLVYLISYDVSLLVISFIILFSGLRYGYFKK